MNQILRKSLLAVGAVALTESSGTSASSWLQGVNVTTDNSSGSTQVTLTAKLNTGQIALPPVSYSFPQTGSSQVLGSISVTSPSTTETDVVLTYDLPASLSALNLPTTTTLPNGTAIPTSGPNSVWQYLSSNLKSSSPANALLYLN